MSSKRSMGKPYLVGSFNPFEKYARQNGFIFPNFRGENKRYLSCHHLCSEILTKLLMGDSEITSGSLYLPYPQFHLKDTHLSWRSKGPTPPSEPPPGNKALFLVISFLPITYLLTTDMIFPDFRWFFGVPNRHMGVLDGGLGIGHLALHLSI